MYYVIDESSYRIDKTSFASSEEAESRAAEAAKILGRAINVYALQAGELNFAFRVMPDGTVEDVNPLTEPQAGGEQIEPTAPVALGAIFDEVSEALESAGQLKLAAAVDHQRLSRQRAKGARRKKPAKTRGLASTVKAAPSFDSGKAIKELNSMLSQLGENDPLSGPTRMIDYGKVIKSASKRVASLLSSYRARIDGIRQEWVDDTKAMPPDMQKRAQDMISSWQDVLKRIDQVSSMKESSPLEMSTKVRSFIKLLTP